MSSAPNLSTTNACGACGAHNDSSAHFCSGCGKSLWEPCPNCSVQVQIGKNFCGGCGYNLLQASDERRSQLEAQLAEMVQHGENQKYLMAISVGKALSRITDHRFETIVSQAKQLTAQFEQIVAEWKEKLEHLPAQAQNLLNDSKFEEAAELLEPIPPSFLDDGIAQLQHDARQKARMSRESKDSLKAAIAKKDWLVAIYELNQLIELFPLKQKYTELRVQVSDKISKQASILAAAGKFAEALEFLDRLPADCQSDRHQALRSRLNELVFLRRMVGVSPFCTPLVGAGLEKLSKLTPDDSAIQQLVQQFDRARKRKPKEDFHVFPAWMKTQGGIFEFSLEPAGLPASVGGARPAILQKASAQFWTAFGLAVQGLGRGAETGNFIQSGKGGVFGLLGGKRKKTEREAAWGVDIGDHSIKAIKLKTNGEQIAVDHALSFSISSHSDSDAPKSTRLFKSLEQAFADPTFRDVPLVANMPTSDLLARYLELPADRPNQHETFIQQEAQAHIPIAIDLLSTAYVKFEKPNETAVSQQAMLLALRKNDIESRSSIMKKLDVNLVSLSAEPFAHVAGLTTLGLVPRTEDVGSQDAILLVDIGHLRTTFQIVTSAGCWFRTIDWGIDSLNQALATHQKLTNADADALRRNLTRSRSISECFAVLKDSCAVPKRELERSLRAAADQIGQFRVVRALLIGGGAYQPLLGSLLNNENI